MMFVKVYFLPLDAPAVVADGRAECGVTLAHFDAEGHIIPTVCVDVGVVQVDKPTTLNGEPCNLAAHIADRLEMHPHASDHPDAPLVRFIPGHKPDAHHYCPTGLDAIKTHLAERGKDGLHPQVMALLKSQLCHRDDIDAATCRNMGMSYAEVAKITGVL